MAIPKRAKQKGHGYTFRVRQSIATTGASRAFWLSWGAVVGALGVVMAAVVVCQGVLISLGFDVQWAEAILPTLFLLATMSPIPPMGLALAWSVRTGFRLRVDGRLAVLTRGSKRVWSGPVSEVRLVPGEERMGLHEYWILTAGDEELEIINPRAELEWLRADLTERSAGAGTERDIPDELLQARGRVAE